MRRLNWMIAATILSLAACGEPVDEASTCDHDEHTVTFPLAEAGRWIPPDDVLGIANQQYLPYSGAPTSCSGNLRAGTREFAEFLKREFEGATSYGGYACRANTANPSQYSVHASGRAIDLFVPLAGSEADNDLGDPIANYLIMNAQEIGVEFVVWDRTSWGAHRDAPKHRAYTGPHPHHDHLHIELKPSSADTPGRTFPPVIRDTPPVGYLDVADCDSIRGWSQDPDAPDAPVDVYISIGGPVFTEGAAGYFVTADIKRDDLCEAIDSCNHGFLLPIPRGLMDGTPREVYAYGMDLTGPQNSELRAAPKTIQCDPPELPFGPDYGVRRHIPNPETLEAWAFDGNDIARFVDDDLLALPQGEPLGSAPRLVRQTGDTAVFLVEDGTHRHVSNPATMSGWRFDWDAIEDVEALPDTPLGAALQPRPFLAQGSGPEVYLIVPPRPLWAEQFEWAGPNALGRNQTATYELRMLNRGAVTWEPELFEVRGCDGRLDRPVGPGESATLACMFTAPDDLGSVEQCVQPVFDGWEFDEHTCLTINVVAEPVALPGHEDPSDHPMVIDARGGCSSTGDATATWWSLFVVLIVGPARRPMRRRRVLELRCRNLHARDSVD